MPIAHRTEIVALLSAVAGMLLAVLAIWGRSRWVRLKAAREWADWERLTRERAEREAEARGALLRAPGSGGPRVLSAQSGIVEADGEVLIFPGSTPAGVPRPESDAGDD